MFLKYKNLMKSVSNKNVQASLLKFKQKQEDQEDRDTLNFIPYNGNLTDINDINYDNKHIETYKSSAELVGNQINFRKSEY